MSSDRAIFKSMLSPSYINSKGILFQDDCLNVIRNINADSIDCIFADPPFNLDKTYEDTNYNDKMDELKYEHWINEWLFESIRILKPGGSLFVYHMPYYLVKIATYLNTFPTMRFRNWIALNMKSGFPIRNRLHPAHYGLLYFIKKGEKFTFNVVRTRTPTCRHCGKLIKDYGGYRHKFTKWEDEEGIPWTQISDYWDDTRPARQYDKKRAFQINELPYEIPERAILLSTRENDIVFDPFGGSGSTYYASCMNNRLWIGTELGDTSIIVRRLLDFQGRSESTPPSKIKTVFGGIDKSNLVLSDKRKKEVSKIIHDYEEAIKDIDKTKKNGRYSHRMTNRIFET